MYRFHASHQVEGLAPPWCNEHEHDYTVEVVAYGGAPVVVDTDDLDEVWMYLKVFCEGKHLNDTMGGTTTVEDLAKQFLSEFRDNVSEVRKVTVWEDDTRWGSAQ